jgi:hypothetical protein
MKIERILIKYVKDHNNLFCLVSYFTQIELWDKPSKHLELNPIVIDLLSVALIFQLMKCTKLKCVLNNLLFC